MEVEADPSNPSIRHSDHFPLKLLHDLNSFCDILPGSYWLHGVSIGRGIFARGGEAVIRRGKYQGELVAIRQFYAPEDIDWSSPAGNQILKVGKFFDMTNSTKKSNYNEQTVRREMITHRQLLHPNVLRLIGICEDTTEDEGCCPLMMVLPFLPMKVKVYLDQNPQPEVFVKLVSGFAYVSVELIFPGI